MLRAWLTGAVCLMVMAAANWAQAQDAAPDPLEANRAIARGFYEDLWFNNRTERYADYVADTYVVHDTGGRDNLTEPAVTQKGIADFFWTNGEMTGEIDYMIAEGDLVATRWHWTFEPSSFFGRVILGRMDIPIINVFRIEDGRIVEIWNHRHDIDTSQTLPIRLQGFGLGLLIALGFAIYAFVLRRRLKRLKAG